MATTPNTPATAGDVARPKREVITNFRHGASKTVVPVRWQAAYGTTAAEAGTILANTPAVREAIAKRLNVSEAEIKLSVAKRTDLQEGTITLASDAKAKPATRTTASPASRMTPEERVQAWALAYVQAHTGTTFARALTLGKAAVASEVRAAALAELDARISDARDALKALEVERATLAKAK